MTLRLSGDIGKMRAGDDDDEVPADPSNRVNARFIAVLSITAFVLHFAWENTQCIAFFVHASSAPTQVDMVRATLGDVAMTWLAYAAVSLACRQRNWPFGTWSWMEWGTLAGSALVMSVAVERFAIASGRWSYTANNPLVPGTDVSVLPIAQLLLLLPLSFWLAAFPVRRARTRDGCR